MPSVRTEITEIVTGLGMLGLPTVEDALFVRPSVMRNVQPAHWDRLDEAFASGTYGLDFAIAWLNGLVFLRSGDGLRERRPISIEWKGPQNPPGFDFLPADLRIDHVFLVSCKYLSRILANSSPANLFDRCLADRSGGPADFGWYQSVAPDEYQDFYSELRSFLAGVVDLPFTVGALGPDHIARIREHCAGAWPHAVRPAWAAFSLAVAEASAERWRSNLTTAAKREEMLWRLLRLNPAPYFVLGSSVAAPLRLRIGTPWDWRQQYLMGDFDIAGVSAGQPKVTWRAEVMNKATGMHEVVDGHVEVRWSHGRFSAVEAKVYLDTPHDAVPGYFSLA